MFTGTLNLFLYGCLCYTIVRPGHSQVKETEVGVNINIKCFDMLVYYNLTNIGYCILFFRISFMLLLAKLIFLMEITF